MKKFLFFMVPAAAVMLFGAGCADTQTPRNAPQLRQPAPPASPQRAPDIPPEARNVPRPY